MSDNYRYFRITDPVALQRIADVAAERERNLEILHGFMREVGADQIRVNNMHGSLACVEFPNDEPPNGAWRRIKYGWVPRRNTKAGRELGQRWRHLPSLPELSAILKHYGKAHEGMGVLMDGRFFARPEVIGWVEAGVFYLIMPWTASPEEIEAYRKHREQVALAEKEGRRLSKTSWDADLEFHLWTPPAEFVEVRQWEFIKEQEELNFKRREMQWKTQK